MRIIEPFKQFLDGAGQPLVNGWLLFLASGSVDTKKDTFYDSAESIANTNPLQLDGEGRCPDVFGTGTYKVILYTNDEVTNQPNEQIDVKDPVGGSSGTSDFNDWNANAVYSIGDIVKASDAQFYESLQSDNQNNDPTTAEEYWKQIEFQEYWNSTISYNIGDRVIDTINGFDYISLTDNNLNNQPSLNVGTEWENFAVSASAAEVKTEGDIQVARVEDEGDIQVARVEDEGDTQIARVISEGDTQVDRLNTIVTSAGLNRVVRQAIQTTPDLETTPSTVKTVATKSGDLSDTYHDIGLDMLTGSRGGMYLHQPKGVGSGVIQSSMFEPLTALFPDLTDALSASNDYVQQLLSSGIQLGGASSLQAANLLALNTTDEVWMPDGSHWQYNSLSGVAIGTHDGTGADRQLLHPMGKDPLFWAIKDTASVRDWCTGRRGTRGYMRLNTPQQELVSSTLFLDEPTNTYLSLGTSSLANASGQTYFTFGLFGDPLDDLHPGMAGMRGVTAAFETTGSETVETGVNNIQAIIYKRLDGSSDWPILNAASGFGNFTILNDTDAEATQTDVTVNGSEVTIGTLTGNWYMIVIGSTAERDSTLIKQGAKVVRKVGTGATGHRVDLGHDFVSGNNGGMWFGRGIGVTTDNYVGDTINGTGNTLITSGNGGLTTNTGFEAFTTTGVTLGVSGAFNPASLCQYIAFGTNEKVTTSDGLEWQIDRLKGFGMVEVTKSGAGAQTIQHPVGLKPIQIWAKRTDTAEDGIVYNHFEGATKYLKLFATDGSVASITSSTAWNDTEPTTTEITLGSLFADTGTYIVYIWFGEDISAAQDGSLWGVKGASAFWLYPGDSSSGNKETYLGRNPFVINKNNSTAGDWVLRRFVDSDEATFYTLNTTDAEGVSTSIGWEGSSMQWGGGAVAVLFMAFADGVSSGIDDQVILPASASDPFIGSIARGFDDEQGSLDDVVSFDSQQTLTVTGPAGRKYLNVDNNGILGWSTTKPTYERNDFPVASGWIFEILRMQMLFDGAEDPTLFIGECSLDEQGNVYDLVTYAPLDYWESDWFAALVSTTYVEELPWGHFELNVNSKIKNSSGNEWIDTFDFSDNKGSYAYYAEVEDKLIILTAASLTSSPCELKFVVKRSF